MAVDDLSKLVNRATDLACDIVKAASKAQGTTSQSVCQSHDQNHAIESSKLYKFTREAPLTNGIKKRRLGPQITIHCTCLSCKRMDSGPDDVEKVVELLKRAGITAEGFSARLDQAEIEETV